DRNGKVVGTVFVTDDEQVMLISQQGMILRMRAGDIRAIGRATQGVRLIEMEDDDVVVAVAKLAEKEVEGGENGGNGGPTPSDEPAASTEPTEPPVAE